MKPPSANHGGVRSVRDLQSPRHWSHTTFKCFPTWDPGTHGLQAFCRICHWSQTHGRSGGHPFTTFFWNFGMPGSDHLKTVCPTPPMRGVASPLRVAQSQTSQRQGRGGRFVVCGCSVSVWSTLLKHLKTCSSCLSANSSVNSGTIVRKKKFALVDANTTRTTMLPAHLGPSGSFPTVGHAPTLSGSKNFEGCPTCSSNILRPRWAVGNPWSSRHTTACGLCTPAPVGSMPLAFHNLVLPKWMLMLARLRSSVSNRNTSCTLVGLQITHTSSKNAKSFSSSFNFDCTATNALC